MIRGDDILRTLIKLLEDQEQIQITYSIKEGDRKNEIISTSGTSTGTE